MAILVRPDSNNYLGGDANWQYQSDLAAYNTDQQTATDDEEVVSLESSFETEADPFSGSGGRMNGGLNYGSAPVAEDAPEKNNLNIWGEPDYSEYGERGRHVIPAGVSDFYANMDTIDIPAVEGFRLGDGITEEGIEQFREEQSADFEAEQERIPKQREALFKLFGEDQAKFKEVFEVLSVNNKLAFLNTLHTEGAFSKEDYLANAQQIMQQEQQRLYPDREKPKSYYFIYNDYDTGDRLYEVDASFADSANPLFHANEVVLFDDQTIQNARSPLIEEEEYFRQSLGTTNSESADKRSTWVSSRDDFFIPVGRMALAAATGGMSEAAYAAARGLSGETLHGSDWASIAVAGLQIANVITPPTAPTTNAATGVTTAGTAGQGLKIGSLSLSFDQSVALINAVGDADVANVLGATGVGNDIVATTLRKIGVPEGLIDDPDFIKAVFTGITVASEGGSFEDTLKTSVATYIDEGGSFGDLGLTDGGLLDKITETFDPLIGAVDEFGNLLNDAVIQPAGDIIEAVTEPIIEVAKDAGSALDDAVIDPIGEAIETVTDPVIEVVKDVGSALDEEVIDPLGEAIEAVTDPVIEVVKDAGSAAEDVVREVGSAADDVLIEPVKEAIESVDLPDIDLPDLSGFGDIELGGLGFGAGGRPSASRTTDGLFGKELFKFKTKIGVNPEPFIQATERKQQKLEYADLFEEPFKNPFNL